MVVDAAGQVGLYEDMALKDGKKMVKEKIWSSCVKILKFMLKILK